VITLRDYNGTVRYAVVIIACALATAAFAQPRLQGFLTGRAVSVDAPMSWAADGFGKFDVGGDEIVDVEIAQIGIEWAARPWLTLHADGIARREPSETKGSDFGVLQAYADLHGKRWRVRAGSFWLPTSRENTDPLWTSPYTLTYSALNTWIGEEIRPIGIDLQYAPNFYVTLGGTVFRGLDTMGTVLADRGWAFGSRLSVYGEKLPRPDQELETRPMGPDLDDENGYSARIRFQLPERAMIQVARIENRAPLLPQLKGQEPWRTAFTVVSAQVGTTSPTFVAAEWATGRTAVGFPGGSFSIDLDTVYLLVSHKRGTNRWTARADQFQIADDEDGTAITLAWLRDIGKQLRLGAEYVNVSEDNGGTTIAVELRYAFQ
jgi:hypothetical protein